MKKTGVAGLPLAQRASIVAVALAACGVASAEELATGPLRGALGEMKPIADVRLRYESVDQLPMAEEADAAVLRARLGLQTGKAWETSLLAEGEFLWPLQSDYRPDNGAPTLTQYPVVADPESYEVNRLHLTNTTLPGTTLTLGRQRIILDDHRFVGNVGWRQNEQTFDALRVVNQSAARLTIDATYLNQVNRIFGPDSPQGRYTGDGYLMNIAYQFGVGKLTGFSYVLDFDPITSVAAGLDPARASTETYGMRFSGTRPAGDVTIAYTASYATQEDYGANPLSFSSEYYMAELTGGYRQFTLGAGIEVLEGDGVVGFATPLATLHKFQGWADKFLATPVNGIDDRYATFGYAVKDVGPLESVTAAVVYHDYASERLSVDYGSEVNLQLQAKWRRTLATLKYADYEAASSTPAAVGRDTRKIWAQLEFVW